MRPRSRRPRHESPAIVDPPPVAGRPPPHDLDAEAAVLSACMLSRAALDIVLVLLKPEHFYSEANARIWQAIQQLVHAQAPVDIVSVSSWLRDREWLQKMGGAAYLAQLADATPTVGHVAEHAKTVHTKWRLRQLIATCQRTAAEGYNDVGDADTFIKGAAEAVDDIAQGGEKRGQLESAGVAIREAFNEIKTAAERGATISGTPTGYDQLDAKIAGLHDGDLMIVAARPGMGKAQPLDAKVLTPNGWRTMGSLRVGDRVIGADGKPCAVLGVFEQGERDIYRVTMDDGGATECCDEHLWHTRTRADRRGKMPGGVRSTAEMRATLLRCASGGLNHSVRFVKPAEFESLGPLPLAPYLLGLLLGDGSGRSECVRFDNPEADIQARFRELLPVGDAVTACHDGLHHRVRRAQRSGEPSTTKAAMRALGLDGLLSWQKFIPEVYLRASVDDRVALLRGLCDTDGHVVDSGTMVEYSTTSPQLLAGLLFLVGSLGGVASVREKPAHYTKPDGSRVETRTAYRVWIAFPSGSVLPVSSAKHLARWKPGPRRIAERFVKNIEKVGRKPCRCIAVDAADHLYVTDDFIVTHNTAAVMNVAVNVASAREEQRNGQTYVVPGEGVCVFSLEMPRKQLATRMTCSEGRVDLSRVRAGGLLPSDWQRLTEAASYLSTLPIWIDETPAIGLLELRAKVRRQQAAYDVAPSDGKPGRRVGLVIIDYLQLMKGRDDVSSREQEISEISRGLKALAKELRVSVIALSQLNRAVETRSTKDKRPQLSDLRESGAIEQDADTIIFIYRDDYYNPETSDMRGIAELIIAKQRNGPTGKVKVRFTASCARFDNLEPGECQEDVE